MGELLGELLEPVIMAIGYIFGFFVVYLFSLGFLTPGPLGDMGNESRGFTYVRDGDRYLNSDAVALAGIFTILAVAGTVYWIVTG